MDGEFLHCSRPARDRAAYQFKGHLNEWNLIFDYKSYCNTVHFCRITKIYQPTNAYIISHKTLLKHFKVFVKVFYVKLYVHSLVDKFWWLIFDVCKAGRFICLVPGVCDTVWSGRHLCQTVRCPSTRHLKAKPGSVTQRNARRNADLLTFFWKLFSLRGIKLQRRFAVARVGSGKSILRWDQTGAGIAQSV